MNNSSGPRRTISLGFSEQKVLEGQHICYIYNDDSERRQVMGKYFASGTLENEKVLYLADDMTTEEMLDDLEKLGVDIRSKATALEVAEATPTYCPKDVFRADEMLAAIQNFYCQAVNEENYAGARGSGEMSWCLVEGRADRDSLMAYETGLTYLVQQYPYTACCQYDARRFDGDLIMDVLSVHPVMIVRGQLVKNPFYVEPEEFLRELRSR